MASRAHVIHDYSYIPASPRQRRQVLYRSSEDPVELPRETSSVSGGLIISALIAAGVTLGGAYAVYYGARPALTVTPTLQAAPQWQPDLQPSLATNMKLLLGPPLATPASPASGVLPGETAASEIGPSSNEVIVDDRLQLTQPPADPVETTPVAPAQPRPATYPNPTTTPPDAIAPPNASPAVPTPGLDPENPY